MLGYQNYTYIRKEEPTKISEEGLEVNKVLENKYISPIIIEYLRSMDIDSDRLKI